MFRPCLFFLELPITEMFWRSFPRGGGGGLGGLVCEKDGSGLKARKFRERSEMRVPYGDL